MNSVMLKEKIRSSVKLHHLAALYQMMIENKDNENAIKILELYEKLDKKEMMVSFAGHFSAGKSSMINTLLGMDILPKSPIPTSANIVEISSGEGVARVFFHNQDPIEYEEPYDIDMIKQYSKDKDAIKRIEISSSQPIIPPGCKIMDTPGIDAADDADRLMTEASLHLVDVLYYVMDYNHVQSEVNLRFLKGLQDQKIPFYVIINQVDKHDEAELPFYTFDKSIKQTFDQWDIFPLRVFYSSLFAPSMSQNELPEIKQTLFTIMGEEKEAYSSTDQAVKNVVESHKRFLKNKYEEKISFHEMQEEDADFNQIEVLKAELEQMDSDLLQLEEDFHYELQQTLKNAYLMPSSLRDKAELFLESRQNDFKAGFFHSKKKTELEREKRQSNFIKPLQETMEAAIEWRLRDKFTALIKNYTGGDTLLQNEIERVNVEYTGENLLKLIKPGAKLNGNFVLNYTNDVSADIKNLYKQKARKLWSAIYTSIHKKNNQQRIEVENQINYLQQLKNNNTKKAALEKELKEKCAAIDLQLELDTVNAEAGRLIENEQIKRHKPLKVVTDFNYVPEPEEKQQHHIAHTESEEPNNYSVESMLESIETAVNTVKDLPGFQTIINDLGRKQERLAHRSYTIALFGAFSAGKSSFANALLGKRVLPVSPNPTTAAINRINPVSEQREHGTVVVTLKDKETLFHDLLSITKKFSPSETDFEALLNWVRVNEIHQNEQLNNLYQSYLQALIKGYKEAGKNIGNKITINLDAFHDYVTDETKACYIESIDLYYDCSVTRQGITLVDTPGADSVNARHTNASFDYIKYADAILYVTYYNHALSRADKDFLMQLGRVKEAFELDKMFFIINAADLANNAKELQVVKNYVEDQLIQLGVRLPRLFPVSSKQSLQNKLEDQALNPQMADFEKAFFHFIHHDLTSLTVKAALWDLQRMYQQIRQYLRSLDMDNKEKEDVKLTLSRRKDILNKTISGMETNVFEKQMNQKVEKQLFYVIERLSIRFHDMFKEMFNPTTITESGKQAQIQLKASLQNLIDYVAFELLQELQAVSLRVEGEINILAKEAYRSLAEQCNEIDESFTVPDFEMTELKTPAYQEAFVSVDVKAFSKILSNFKSTKAFFEKNEKEIMKEQLYEKIEILAGDYMNQNKLIMQNAYREQWTNLIAGMKTKIKENADNHIDHYLEMLSKPADLHLVKEKEQVLKEILKSNKV
jgi:GTPase Era involved in 16S rRNA processing